MKYEHMVKAALIAVLSLWAIPIVHAQVTVAPPAYPGYQGYPGYEGYQGNQGYPGFNGYSQQGQMPPRGQVPPVGENAPALAPNPAAQPVTLPKGIDKIYAMQGNEKLLLFGTEQGFETARELVKLIDGDLDIISTQVALAKTTQREMRCLGVPLGKDGALTTAQIQTLVTAEEHGELPVSALDRVVTREDTAVNILLGHSNLPISLVPREVPGGLLGIQLTQPVTLTATIHPGSTSVVALPPDGTAPSEPVTLLFITPKILSSDYRQ